MTFRMSESFQVWVVCFESMRMGCADDWVFALKFAPILILDSLSHTNNDSIIILIGIAVLIVPCIGIWS